MKRLLALVAISAGPILAQDARWWSYDTPAAEAVGCRIVSSARDLYNELRSDKVSPSDLKSKFPAIGWGSGKIAAAIVTNPQDGDLVQNSLVFSNGNVQFRLVRERVPRLTSFPSRVFVVEIDRAKIGPKPTCTHTVDILPPKLSAPAPTRTIIKQ